MKPPVNATKCPQCGGVCKKVVDSRPHGFNDSWAIKRRRECADCGARHNTFEMLEDDLLFFSIELRRKAEKELEQLDHKRSAIIRHIGSLVVHTEEKAG